MSNPATFDAEKVQANVRRASDEDLLNRITVYRSEIEPEAAALIERELHERGISAADIASYRERLSAEVIQRPGGGAVKCTFCQAPASSEGWDWHRLFGLIPVFPRYLYRCKKHQ